jgi:membrane-associated protease RseP (regulator of RpoE activity)
VTDTIQPEGPSPVDDPRGELAGGWRLALVVGAVLALGILTKASVLIVVLALVVMIFLHELGHFLTAKWSGMKVTELFIGFGPKLWSFRRGETEYGLKAIPAGAYVRIIGMNNLEEVPPEDEPRTYRQQSFPKRLLVVSAGSLMHFLQAFVLLVLLLGVTGVPSGVFDTPTGNDAWVIGGVTDDSAAAAAGVQPGDRVVSFDGIPTPTFDDLGKAVAPRAGEQVSVVIERGGEQRTLDVTVGHREDDASVGFFGIGPSYPDVRLGPVSAVTHSGTELARGARDAVDALGSFVTGGIGGFADQVANGGNSSAAAVGDGSGTGHTSSGARAPADGDQDRLLSIYGAARIGIDLTDHGIADLLLFLVSINIFIGVFNLVPLLPLDGGHVAIAVYERIRSIGGRRYMADVSRLLPLTYAFVALMLLLGMSSLYLDIVDPIGVG